MKTVIDIPVGPYFIRTKASGPKGMWRVGICSPSPYMTVTLHGIKEVGILFDLVNLPEWFIKEGNLRDLDAIEAVCHELPRYLISAMWRYENLLEGSPPLIELPES